MTTGEAWSTNWNDIQPKYWRHCNLDMDIGRPSAPCPSQQQIYVSAAPCTEHHTSTNAHRIGYWGHYYCTLDYREIDLEELACQTCVMALTRSTRASPWARFISLSIPQTTLRHRQTGRVWLWSILRARARMGCTGVWHPRPNSEACQANSKSWSLNGLNTAPAIHSHSHIQFATLTLFFSWHSCLPSPLLLSNSLHQHRVVAHDGIPLLAAEWRFSSATTRDPLSSFPSSLSPLLFYWHTHLSYPCSRPLCHQHRLNPLATFHSMLTSSCTVSPVSTPTAHANLCATPYYTPCDITPTTPVYPQPGHSTPRV